jgi:hypothetical protein
MPDYSQSRIYKLINKDDNRIYIGSTVQSLAYRKAQHKSHRNTMTRDFNWDNVEMTLIDCVSCLNKDELFKIERKYIEENECINIRPPIRTEEEKKQYQTKKNLIQNGKRSSLERVKCSLCNTEYSNKYKYNIHIKTKKHLSKLTS